ncbi:MAG: hypothetical protein AAF682_27975 [Planctomycetota bacterium]
MKNIALPCLPLTLALTLTLSSSAGAQGVPSTLYGGAVAGANEGNLVAIDQTSYATSEVIGTAYSRMSGLAITPDGRMWASMHFPANDLLELDPDTAQVLSTVTLELDGESPHLSDLAVQPGTGTLFGLGRNSQEIAVLYTIDPATGAMVEIGTTGATRQGGLAFASDGTLYMSESALTTPLHTLDPATGAILSTTIVDTVGMSIHGLTFDPLTDELYGCSGNGDIITIDPATGVNTFVAKLDGVAVSDLEFRLPEAKEQVRNSTLSTPNLAQLLPGVTSGPVIGAVWDPVIVSSPGTTSLVDVLITALTPADVPLLPGPNGTLLCNILPGIADTNFSTPIGGVQQPFAIPFPDEPSIIGITLCTQGGYADGTTPGMIHLTNALDITIGAL